MSEEKKHNPGEEPVKLNMSFEDAIRLAMNTKPLEHIELQLNKRIELKKAFGKTAELASIQVTETNKDLSFYRLYIELIEIIENEKKVIAHADIIFPNVQLTPNFMTAVWPKGKFRFQVTKNRTLYAELRPMIDNIQSGKAILFLQLAK